MKAQKGFTLVEILIVVVILGILAAIVVPQFTQASTEAKFNSLCSNLQSIRSQIELYKVQHTDMAPGNLRTGGTVAIGGDPEAQLMYTTDADGNVNGTSKARTGLFQFGPYLERVPTNPFNNQSGIAVGAADTFGTATATDGWEYNPTTGEIRAGDGGTTNEIAHNTL